MLIGDGFLIASPTKTGTKSLKHLALANGLRYVAPGHGMRPPRGFQSHTRHMVVRNPYERLASIYGYLRRRVGDWGHEAAIGLTFAGWVGHFLDLRAAFDPRTYDANAPSIWLATQADCWRVLRGNVFWRLESIGDLLARIGIAGELPVLNRGAARESVVELYPQSIRERVWNEWAREDCEQFGYGKL